MRDIKTYDDCLLLITKFYDKLMVDEEIGHFFQQIDLSLHIPKVTDFWALILIDHPGYTNNMMGAHAKLDLQEADFKRWLYLFHETTTEHFQGEKANLAIERSKLIAWTMTAKLNN